MSMSQSTKVWLIDAFSSAVDNNGNLGFGLGFGLTANT